MRSDAKKPGRGGSVRSCSLNGLSKSNTEKLSTHSNAGSKTPGGAAPPYFPRKKDVEEKLLNGSVYIRMHSGDRGHTTGELGLDQLYQSGGGRSPPAVETNGVATGVLTVGRVSRLV